MLGGYVTNRISACMTEKFRIGTADNLDSDVIIDWGDGNVTELKNL